jgi:cytochrome d ubiquinol oxidase subunit I
MTGGDREVFVPGINDLVYNMPAGSGELSVEQKMGRGKEALAALNAFKEAKASGNTLQTDSLKKLFTDQNFLNDNFRYFGYAFLTSPEEAVPDVAISFYSFHIMVLLGFLFIIMCAGAVYLVMSNQINRFRWFLWLLIACVPLVYIASQSGWVLAEMGRQPWIIQNLMPVSVGSTNIGTGAVITTFILFALLFTGLLIAEVSIMTRQIKSGPKH